MMEKKDIRHFLKKKVVEIQSGEIFKRMLVSSKLDRSMLSGYSYSGKMMSYLNELDFVEARAIFMSRYRMWPTKKNYPGRWKGIECNICGVEDTDEHVFTCPGYIDLIIDGATYDTFFDSDVLSNTVMIREYAGMVLKIIERLELIQKLNA